jgi:hypothetical protein
LLHVTNETYPTGISYPRITKGTAYNPRSTARSMASATPRNRNTETQKLKQKRNQKLNKDKPANLAPEIFPLLQTPSRKDNSIIDAVMNGDPATIYLVQGHNTRYRTMRVIHPLTSCNDHAILVHPDGVLE